MAVRERMEEVQRKTSAKTQATQSEGSRGQEPTTSCRRAPGQDCVSVRRSGDVFTRAVNEGCRSFRKAQRRPLLGPCPCASQHFHN